MTTESDTQESGGALRANLEAALAENKALRSLAVDKFVSEHKYVKPEDFKDVSPDQFATKAQEVEQARAQEAQQLLKAALAEQLGSDVDLDEALAKITGKQPSGDAEGSKPTGGTPTFASGVGIAGEPPAAQSTELFGFDGLVAAANETLKRLG